MLASRGGISLSLRTISLFFWEIWILERTLFYNWMKDWLRYVHWYHTVVLDTDPKLQDLFEVPVVMRDWKKRPEESILFRYGFLWELYDLVRRKGFGDALEYVGS